MKLTRKTLEHIKTKFWIFYNEERKKADENLRRIEEEKRKKVGADKILKEKEELYRKAQALIHKLEDLGLNSDGTLNWKEKEKILKETYPSFEAFVLKLSLASPKVAQNMLTQIGAI